MQITPVDFGAARPIEGYGPGFFRYGGEVYHGPTLFAPGLVRAWGGLSDWQSLVDLAGQLDVLFIGTGAEIAPLPAAFRKELEALGLGVENMSSTSAARTYNVLLSEGRRVAAALMPV